ncbi:MAG TPA: 5'-nucleotidase [Myxococcaceae bacterium]|nr:5'-nucleotidase [Myxococcaceae bacterium]
MFRTLRVPLLALALAPGLGCLQYNDPCQPLVEDPEAVVGYLGEDVYLDKPFTRHGNHALGQLAADALFHAEDGSSNPAVLGLVNGGALRAEGLCITRSVLPKGPLRNGLLHEILLFENAVVTVDITEQQLVAMLERSAEGLFPAGESIVSPAGALLHVSEGTRVRVDCERPRGQRVVELTLTDRRSGQPVAMPLPPRTDPSIRYRVAMSSFILQGGDGYGAILGDTGTDPSRNPVQARTLEGMATDANLTEDYMRSTYPSEARALREDGRIIFDNCAQPARSVGP